MCQSSVVTKSITELQTTTFKDILMLNQKVGYFRPTFFKHIALFTQEIEWSGYVAYVRYFLTTPCPEFSYRYSRREETFVTRDCQRTKYRPKSHRVENTPRSCSVGWVGMIFITSCWKHLENNSDFQLNEVWKCFTVYYKFSFRKVAKKKFCWKCTNFETVCPSINQITSDMMRWSCYTNYFR